MKDPVVRQAVEQHSFVIGGRQTRSGYAPM